MNNWLLRILILILSTGSTSAWSQEDLPTSFDAVRIAPYESDDLKLGASDELTFKYDPSALQDAVKIDIEYSKLQNLSREMSSEVYQRQLQEKVIIPIASASAEKLELAEKLSPEELKSFLSKKTKFLESVAKTFTFIKFQPKAVNKIIFLLNDHFFKNAGVIANANTRVLNLQIGIGGGLGLADWMMSQLKKSPYFRDLPNTTGFYFMLGTGISFGKTVENGKTRFFIEPIIEFRRSTKIFSPFLFGAAGFIGNFTWENRSKASLVQEAAFYKVSSATVINGGQHFGFSGAAAMALPPGGGAVAGIEGKVYRLRLTVDIFPKVFRLLQEFALVHSGRLAKCSGVFL